LVKGGEDGEAGERCGIDPEPAGSGWPEAISRPFISRQLSMAYPDMAALATWENFGAAADPGLPAENAHGSGGGGSITSDDHAGFSTQGLPCTGHWRPRRI
jgi:hypothetical protein